MPTDAGSFLDSLLLSPLVGRVPPLGLFLSPTFTRPERPEVGPWQSCAAVSPLPGTERVSLSPSVKRHRNGTSPHDISNKN